MEIHTGTVHFPLHLERFVYAAEKTEADGPPQTGLKLVDHQGRMLCRGPQTTKNQRQIQQLKDRLEEGHLGLRAAGDVQNSPPKSQQDKTQKILNVAVVILVAFMLLFSVLEIGGGVLATGLMAFLGIFLGPGIIENHYDQLVETGEVCPPYHLYGFMKLEEENHHPRAVCSIEIRGSLGTVAGVIERPIETVDREGQEVSRVIDVVRQAQNIRNQLPARQADQQGERSPMLDKKSPSGWVAKFLSGN